MTQIHSDEYVVAYKDDEATKQALFDKLVAFYKKHEAFSGESIMQCDGPQLEAAELLSDIADDILQFEWTWK